MTNWLLSREIPIVGSEEELGKQEQAGRNETEMPEHLVAWNLKNNEEPGKAKFSRPAAKISYPLWCVTSLALCFSVI